MTTFPQSQDLEALLSELEALDAKRCPGEWYAKPYGVIVGGPAQQFVRGSAQSQIASANVMHYERSGSQEDNTAFIAAAPKMMQAIRALKQERDAQRHMPRMRRHVAHLRGSIGEAMTTKLSVKECEQLLSHKWYPRTVPRDMQDQLRAALGLLRKLKAEALNDCPDKPMHQYVLDVLAEAGL